MAPGRLQNKVAIVTGAAGGMGRATSLLFAKEGAAVVVADIKEEGSPGDTPTAQAIQDSGGKSLFVKTDVGDASSVKKLVEAAVAHFGRVDIIVNNAGIGVEAANPRPIYETPESVFDTAMRVNSKGVWLGCKYAGEQMMKQDIQPGSTSRGWIVNIGSCLGLTGKAGTSSYTASKGAVISMTRAIAMEYAPFQIHCNSICPGFTDTAMIKAQSGDQEIRKAIDAAHPLKGLGQPEDIARAALFLASNDCSWVTAACLSVDGGYVAQ